MQPLIERHLRRIRWTAFLNASSGWIAAALLLAGGSSLLLRRFELSVWLNVGWYVAVCAPVLLIGIWRTNHRCSRRDAIADVDRRMNLDGLLMALEETGDLRWFDRLPSESMWKADLSRIRPRRVVSRLVVPSLFLMGACLVPMSGSRATIAPPSMGIDVVAELASMIDTLDKERLLSQVDHNELQNAIDVLQRELAASPLGHEEWEMIDALRARIVHRLDDASVTTDNALQSVQRLANALLNESPGDQIARLEEETIDAIQDAVTGRKRDSTQAAALREGLERLLKTDSTPAHREDREAAIGQLQDQLQTELERFVQLSEAAGLADNMRRRMSNAASRQLTGPSQETQNTKSTWGEETEAARDRFRNVVLPSTSGQRREMAGVRRFAPRQTESSPSPRNEEVTSPGETDRTVWKRTLRPRHQRVVKQYFLSSQFEER